MGGIGKTTLAQFAYNDSDVFEYFDKRMWVCVSDPFDELRIAKAIIEALEGFVPTFGELNSLLESIRASLVGKKFLLILDDMWTDDYSKWEPFHYCLKNGVRGSMSKSFYQYIVNVFKVQFSQATSSSYHRYSQRHLLVTKDKLQQAKYYGSSYSSIYMLSWILQRRRDLCLLKSILPMVNQYDIMFGGQDTSDKNLADAMARAKVFDVDL
ncbi:hypothetical protein WN943_023843 [Citrus x changshan-huyou]